MNEAQRLRSVLDLLPVLAAVEAHGGVSAAADELGMPQSSVSRGMRRLGDLVGAPVIRRRGRGVELTAAGTELVAVADTATTRLRGVLGDIDRGVELSAGTLSLAFQTLLGETLVPEAIARFGRRHPAIRFTLSQGSRAHCVGAVRRGDADLALVASPPSMPGAFVVDLYSEPLVAITAPAHPLAARTSVSVEDLRDEDLIMLGPGFGLQEAVQRLLTTAAGPPTAAFEVGDYHTARALARAGLGVAVLPRGPATLRDDAAEITIEHPAARRDIGAVVATGPSAAVEEFLSTVHATAHGAGH